jgi:hypothetical protein
MPYLSKTIMEDMRAIVTRIPRAGYASVRNMPLSLCVTCGVLVYGQTSSLVPCGLCTGPLTPVPAASVVLQPAKALRSGE